MHGQVSYQELSTKTWKFLRSIAAESFQVPAKQVPRVLFHGLILACIIAGFWLIDSLKDPVLAATVGIEYQPIAKLLSVLTTLVVVCVYDFLTSVVTKPSLFHIISSFFGLLMMILSALLADGRIGLSNDARGPSRWIGWLAYFSIEAYGSLMTALFWSFTNSIMDLEQAKGAYGLIIAIAQVGAILGSTAATHTRELGIPALFIFGAIMIFSVSLLIKTYHITYHDYITESVKTRVRSISENDTSDGPLLPSSPKGMSDEPVSHVHKHKEEPSLVGSCGKVLEGFYEGLSLIARHGYVMKLLGVACLYEIVVTILDYEFKIMGSHASTAAAAKATAGHLLSGSHLHQHGEGAEDYFANLLGHFGQVTNLFSFFLSFFGFSYLVHHIGVDKSLMVFPITLLVAVIATHLAPSMWVLFFFVSLLKGMIFSLHDPVKELLYIPTSESIKFKAKAWIDVFGSRLAKAAGSVITSLAAGDAARLHSIGEIPAIVLTILIIILTYQMGQDFNALVESNTIIGEAPRPTYMLDVDGPLINGLRPGDVGYAGYDPELFEGVDFDPEGLGGRMGGVEMVTLSKGMQALKDAQAISQPAWQPVFVTASSDGNRGRTKSAHI